MARRSSARRRGGCPTSAQPVWRGADATGTSVGRAAAAAATTRVAMAAAAARRLPACRLPARRLPCGGWSSSHRPRARARFAGSRRSRQFRRRQRPSGHSRGLRATCGGRGSSSALWSQPTRSATSQMPQILITTSAISAAGRHWMSCSCLTPTRRARPPAPCSAPYSAPCSAPCGAPCGAPKCRPSCHLQRC